MKINILSPGRFHVLDLARELNKQGFDVKFYSFVPTNRAEKFGLPKECSASLFYYLLPFLGLCKIFRGHQWATQLRIWVQDRLTAFLMRDCDVLIAMSGDFVIAPKFAKTKGSVVITERGSKHILEQKRILESIPSMKGKKPVPDANVRRELECYEIADYISVGAEHVARSFMSYPNLSKKLFVDNYGVNLSMFHPISNVSKDFDVITTGGWCYQKGCDLIYNLSMNSDYKFLHVGSVVDVPLPSTGNFMHFDTVDQSELYEYYARAKVFLLPSRQEGLAMVQAQAIACNLPIIGSKDSGAEDLKKLVAKPEYVIIIKDYSVKAVREAIETALKLYDTLGEDLYAGTAIANLTWEAYGKRYANFLKSIQNGKEKNRMD